ncbi:type II secretion system major pseudopilin GspG [uncultured Tateyamaria sp.]|uniref:type II secretion system major pseudopilin GspG n=1 Tax=uncultured Tateyamaria sp. TaxID=455651 RepID=UPI002626BEFA|nr:type II secretion system major pseudopilin GspG [uncultured Tateyamaria sp.]
MKRTKGRQKRSSELGISMLEIMVVLAIITLIAGLAAPRVIDNFGRAKSQAAEIQLNSLNGALRLYYVDVGRYPTEAEGLGSLLVAPSGLDGWRGPYVEDEEELLDPWGRDFLYRSPGQSKPFDLFSYGRDGQAGGTNEDSDIYL